MPTSNQNQPPKSTGNPPNPAEGGRTEGEHTPGPYRVDGSHIVSQRTRVQLANVYSPRAYDPKQREEQANAALFAAAPDLLAACKAALHTCCGAPDPGSTLRILRAAIAKAERGVA